MTPRSFESDAGRAYEPRSVDHGAVPQRANERQLLDVRGVQWWVHERAASGNVARSLVCESRHAVRRAWANPADWAALSESALAALFDVCVPASTG